MIKSGVRFVICLLLVLALLEQNTSAESLPFNDIDNSYAKNEIILLNKHGIVLGDGDGRYNPDQSVTRAEFVTMLGRTLGLKPVNSPIQAFRDVPTDNWANGWVNAAAQMRMVNGTNPTTFGPRNNISRQEAAAILVRSSSKLTSATETGTITDQTEVATWALPYVKQAITSGLMNGYDNRFRPKGVLSRQELAVILSRIISAPSNSNQDQSPSIQLAWQYEGSTSDFIQLVQKSPINVLSPRWFFLNENGEIVDNGDINLVTWAHGNGKKVWAMVGNRFSTEGTHQLVTDAARRKEFITQILQFSEKYKLDGINLDFENVQPSDKDDLTQLVKELSGKLKLKGILFSVDVPPILESSWSDAYDYQALGKLVDYIIIMTYEEHWEGGSVIGSVSSLSWFEQHLRKITRLVPSNKVIAGIPLYSRDWFVTSGKVQSRDLQLHEEYALLTSVKPLITWDTKMGQYIATYTRSNVAHTIWLEESRSITEKLKASQKLGITNAAYWHIGGGTDDVWATIHNFVNSRLK